MELDTRDPTKFWRDYEALFGEKVLAHALGCYMTGWQEFQGPLWGLLIATDGGFRFHHFPHEGWIQVLLRMSDGGGSAPKEKTIFIPRNRIIEVQFVRETSWIKKLLSPSAPQLTIRYTSSDDEKEGLLLAETDKTAQSVVTALQTLLTQGS